MAFIHNFTKGDWKIVEHESGHGTKSIEIHDKDGNIIAEHIKTMDDAMLMVQSGNLLQMVEMMYDDWNANGGCKIMVGILKKLLNDAGIEITH